MITAAELVQVGLKQLHTSMDKQLDGITPEQLHAVPGNNPKANTIMWGIWHYVRTEDNVVRYILQNKKVPQWIEGGYAEKLGLPPAARRDARHARAGPGLPDPRHDPLRRDRAGAHAGGRRSRQHRLARTILRWIARIVSPPHPPLSPATGERDIGRVILLHPSS